MGIRIITLAGETCSGTSSIAKELSDLIGWNKANVGDWFRQFLEEKSLDIVVSGNLPDEVHKQFDIRQKNLIATSEHLIVEGRLSGWLSKEFPDVYRIWCYAPDEVRVERYSNRENVNMENAREILQERDDTDKNKYQKLYDLQDYRSSDFYDLVIDTSLASPKELAQNIYEIIKTDINSE